MTYRIRTVSEITGVPRNTLIAWERRYGAVRPERHNNGYRSYSEGDVARLLRIKNALKAGLKISEAVSLINDKSSGEARIAEPGLGPATDDAAFVAVSDELLEALVEYRKDDAERILARLMTVPFATRLHGVYFPVLAKIGEKWVAGEISIAQEHYASAMLRSHFASILVSIGPTSTHGPHAACTTFPGDMHEMAALALSIQLSLNGYRVSYLGANLPTEEMRDFHEKEHTKLLCVSVIAPVKPEQVREYARTLAPSLGGARLILGGRALSGIDIGDIAGVELLPNWTDLGM